MEDILKFLIVAGIIVVGIARQYKKEAKKYTRQDTAIPGPQPPPIPATETRKRGKTIIPDIHERKTVRTTHISPPPQSSWKDMHDTCVTGTEKEDLKIRSVEDVRKAIVWGEILQRKY